jgi:hypothetical protein
MIAAEALFAVRADKRQKVQLAARRFAAVRAEAWKLCHSKTQ